MKKRVLLINPAFLPTQKNIWSEVSCAYPPLGLAYAAALLEQKLIHVQILDLKVTPLTSDQFIEKLRVFQPDMIGISATTPTIKEAWDIAETTKKNLPTSIVVLGGVHPTVMPEESLNKPFIDAIAHGEGEYTFIDLCLYDTFADIQGISYKKNGKIIHNPNRPPIQNLDELPFPAYHLLDIKKYHPPLGNYKQLPSMIMLTTRGCPGRCTFCYSGIKEKNIRTRSAENIIAEIQYLKKHYGIKEISFYDDVFTLFKDKVRKLCQTLINEHYNITWTCMTRINLVDEEILRLMKKAGCHQICYGIESADETILKNIQKDLNLAQARDVIAMTKRVGIRTRISLMFGNPGETEETMQKTINFALETNPDIVMFNVATAYPGTEMHTWAKQHGLLTEKPWTEYDMGQYTLQLPNVSEAQVQTYYKRAYKQFYFRPRYILQRLLNTQSWYDIKENMHAVKGLARFMNYS